MHSYEIEIKSLLGGKEKADALIDKIKADPSFVSIGSHKQLNHYFVGGNLNTLAEKVKALIPDDKKASLANLPEHAKDFSVRTRWADGKVLLVIKATVDDTTSSNGTARIEFESPLEVPLEVIDKLLLDSGFSYQAKWSRERQEFKYKDLSVAIDKNAGYGYLAEFEKVIDDQSKADETKTSIRACMEVLGIEELPQDRLERMFAFYNQNWQDYYGTEKTFIID